MFNGYSMLYVKLIAFKLSELYVHEYEYNNNNAAIYATI